MTLEFGQTCNAFKAAVEAKNTNSAEDILLKLKKQMIMMDSLPPVNANTPSAAAERAIAREVYEYAVLHAINCGFKEDFQRYMSCLRPYYLAAPVGVTAPTSASGECSKETFLGLKLLYLLVENRLSEFHSEIELLTEAELSHPHIAFCTLIEQHVMVGSYDQVMVAARNPPCRHFAFFLDSLMETVRLNVAECMQAAYKTIKLRAAMDLMMMPAGEEAQALAFISKSFPQWTVTQGANADSTLIEFKTKVAAAVSAEIPSHKVMQQVLTYATELERIV